MFTDENQYTPYVLRRFACRTVGDTSELTAKLYRGRHHVADLYVGAESPQSLKVEFVSSPDVAMLSEHLRRHGYNHSGGEQAVARFLEELIDAERERQWLRSMSRRHTLFRLRGDEPDVWRAYPGRYSEKVARAIRRKVGAQLERIAGDGLLRRAGAVGTTA